MNFWIDAQLPPSLAVWLTEAFEVSATSLRDLGLRDAEDAEIFYAARAAGIIVIVSKDSDFVDLATRMGAPPQILWVTTLLGIWVLVRSLDCWEARQPTCFPQLMTRKSKSRVSDCCAHSSDDSNSLIYIQQ